MNSCASSSIINTKSVINDLLIECISNNSNKSHDKKFKWSHSTQNTSKSNQHSSNWVRSCSKWLLLKLNNLIPSSLKDLFPKSRQWNIHLYNNSINKERISQCRPWMILNKRHQESKPNQHHYINILVHGIVVIVGSGVVMNFGSYKDAINDNDNQLYN